VHFKDIEGNEIGDVAIGCTDAFDGIILSGIGAVYKRHPEN
jgi:uncharacterized membrane protein